MEGLLSCHGDEMGMLEDMMVAMDDLSTVSFKIVLETTQKSSLELSTKRQVCTCVCVGGGFVISTYGKKSFTEFETVVCECVRCGLCNQHLQLETIC